MGRTWASLRSLIGIPIVLVSLPIVPGRERKINEVEKRYGKPRVGGRKGRERKERKGEAIDDGLMAAERGEFCGSAKNPKRYLHLPLYKYSSPSTYTHPPGPR
jgi:hypothetical protein